MRKGLLNSPHSLSLFMTVHNSHFNVLDIFFSVYGVIPCVGLAGGCCGFWALVWGSIFWFSGWIGIAPLLSNVHDYILIIEQCQVCHQNHHNQKDKSWWQLMPGLLMVEVGKATQAGRTDDDADDSDDHCSDDEAWWTTHHPPRWGGN